MTEFPMFCCFHNNREIQWTLSFDPEDSEHKMRKLMQIDEETKRLIGLSDLSDLPYDEEKIAKRVMVEIKDVR